MTTLSADFETTTNKVDTERTRVWSWAYTEINNENNEQCGTTIDSFIEAIRHKSSKIYFHNLGFDGEFIVSWLFNNGFEHVEERNLLPKEFNSIISNQGAWYKLSICWGRDEKGKLIITEIFDSFKKLPFSVDTISKAFDLDIKKLEIDYDEYRSEEHILTDEEKEYVLNDVRIVAEALNIQFKDGMKKMTIGSDALNDYKNIIGKKQFKSWFPILPHDFDDYIRKSYRGGWTMVKEEEAGKDQGKGCSYDVNSLYPWAMHDNLMPYGRPLFFEGEYEENPLYPIYLQRISVVFKLKKGYLPTLLVKGAGRFGGNAYIKESGRQPLTLTLTSVDYELFKKHYDIEYERCLDGMMFQARNDMFKGFIDKFTAVKEQASIDGNEAIRTLAKLRLNNLYGKFATSTDMTKKVPYLDEQGIVKLKLSEQETITDPVYTAVASFTTAYARKRTIETCQNNYDRFIYSDTDSAYFKGVEEPQDMEIHATNLGAWKLEHIFDRGRFLKQKTYIIEENNKIYVTCAGMSDKVKQQVTWDNFYIGKEFSGNLKKRKAIGGALLDDVTFKITDKKVG